MKDAGDKGKITQKFSSELEAALTNDSAMMRELFTKEEILNLRRLSRVTRTISERPTNLSNPSKSGDFLSYFSRRFGGPAVDVIRNLPIAKDIIRGLSDGKNARLVERSLNPN